MSHLKVKKPEEKNHGFKWGIEKGVGGKNRDIIFYESFTYEGEEYLVHDCVYFDLGQPEAFIGKLVKMFEGPTHVKKVKVVWFMRPSEIRNYLGDYEPRWNEIFLASGRGRGVSNINLVESIVGKCNVVCTSNDRRNPQASEADLRWADYFFCCHFDVRELAILDVFPDMVDGVKVEHFFNKKKEQKPLGPPNLKSNVKEQIGIPNLSSTKLKVVKAIGNTVKDDNSCSRVSSLVKESKIAPVIMSKKLHLPSENTLPGPKTSVPNSRNQHCRSSHCQVQDEVDKAEVKFTKDSLTSSAEIQPYKKRKLFLDERTSGKFDNLDHQLGQDRGINIDNQLVQVLGRTDAHRRNWFYRLPWGQRLERAQEAGSLISLDNLDASYTSAEVEDLVWHAFKEKVEAKMIEQSTFSCPCYGKALIIFKSKEAADSAIYQLTQRCLMLADGRPLIARKETLVKPAKLAAFVGHLTIDKVQHQRQNEDMKKAKSTSHASQPNSIEYDMGTEWRILQQKSDIWWKTLHERQAKEIQMVRNQLKMKCSS
ncbi:protein ANTI-SILENCING 1-like [Durio zibethinus]|uniref:Protein ANTI-SILENCING 1-like n=1 Tax=Durio zibethinus TaxID=66656 RepID=A0A6P5WZ64_DURZI|nr:protein ANTI-SILENCING 1-like [Durio zibethinus]